MKQILLPVCVVSAALLLAGCGPKQFHLRDPKTGQVVECKPDPWATFTPEADAEKCAKGFEHLGYQRVYN